MPIKKDRETIKTSYPTKGPHMNSNILKDLAERARECPEFLVFEPPASKSQISRAESEMGAPFPGVMGEMLSSFNGGFISATGKVSECPVERGHAKGSADVFLSAEESAKERKRLLRLRPDVEPPHFPFFPFARTFEGELLAVDVSGKVFTMWGFSEGADPQSLNSSLPETLSLYLDNEGVFETG